MKNAAYRISGSYILAGVLWIYFSDKFLNQYIVQTGSSSEIVFLNNIKGIGYVLVSGLLLFFLVKRMYNHLNQLQHDQRRLFEKSPNPMLILSSQELEVLDANFAAIDFWGISLPEIKKHDVGQLLPPNAITLLKNKQSSEGQKIETSRLLEIILPGGQKRRGNILLNTIIINKKTAIIVTFLDATDKNIFEERISEILEIMPEGFIAIDTSWKCIYINKEFEKFFSIHRRDLLNKNVLDVYPRVRQHGIYQLLLQSSKKGVSSSFIEYIEETDTWLYITLYPTRDGISAILQNITAARKSENQILRQQHNLNALINATDDLVWSVNSMFKLISANQAFKLKMLEHTGKRFKENDLLLEEHFDPDFLKKWKGLYNRALQGEAFLEVTESVDPVEKRAIFMETHFNPIRNEGGEITGIGCVSRDISERKNQEIHIRNQNEKLREIAWMQSHEIRAPVANILGLIDLMRDSLPQEDLNYSILDKIDTCGRLLDERILNIVLKSAEVESMTRAEEKRTGL